jgi:transcriptional regulator with XRE-family HTH domain
VLKNDLSAKVLGRLRKLRTAAGIKLEQMDEKLVLGSGWTQRFESGEAETSLRMIGAMLHAMGKQFSDLIVDWEREEATTSFEREVRAEAGGGDLCVRFPYGKHDAQFIITNATMKEFDEVIDELRERLSGATEDEDAYASDAVANCFNKAIKFWPHANPSDLWYFVVLRAYCDPFNHRAKFARKDFEQSWKRTGGWALEKVVVDQYHDALRKRGINILTGTKEQKQAFFAELGLADRLEADKADILLTARSENGADKFFGIVHVKASFAERRTDDVPMSQALVKAGFTSPLVTMDCKATPRANPFNRGEMGQVSGKRSAKRKDIEDEKFFSACFSYNRNTIPTPDDREALARIRVLDFNNPDDLFVDFIVEEWDRIRSRQAEMLARARHTLAAAATED